MEKENLYLIHGEDYLRHIEEKLELLWMATILMHYIKNGAEKDGYLDLVRRSPSTLTSAARRCSVLGAVRSITSSPMTLRTCPTSSKTT